MAIRFLSPRNLAMSEPRVAAPRQRAGLRSLALIASVCATTVASAAEPTYNDYEITPIIGFSVGGEFEDPVDGSDLDVEEDTSFGLIFNIAADEWRHYEFLLSNLSSSVEADTPFDIDIQYLQIGGTVSSPDAERVIPYFGMTVGAARLSPDQAGLDDETKFALTVGAGMKIPITDRIGVRFDARAFITLFDTDSDIFCISSGGAGTCRIKAKSDTFVQYSAALGITVGF
jgi:opacity protein-like surface antigen